MLLLPLVSLLLLLTLLLLRGPQWQTQWLLPLLLVLLNQLQCHAVQFDHDLPHVRLWNWTPVAEAVMLIATGPARSRAGDEQEQKQLDTTLLSTFKQVRPTSTGSHDAALIPPQHSIWAWRGCAVLLMLIPTVGSLQTQECKGPPVVHLHQRLCCTRPCNAYVAVPLNKLGCTACRCRRSLPWVLHIKCCVVPGQQWHHQQTWLNLNRANVNTSSISHLQTTVQIGLYMQLRAAEVGSVFVW